MAEVGKFFQVVFKSSTFMVLALTSLSQRVDTTTSSPRLSNVIVLELSSYIIFVLIIGLNEDNAVYHLC